MTIFDVKMHVPWWFIIHPGSVPGHIYVYPSQDSACDRTQRQQPDSGRGVSVLFFTCDHACYLLSLSLYYYNDNYDFVINTLKHDMGGRCHRYLYYVWLKSSCRNHHWYTHLSSNNSSNNSITVIHSFILVAVSSINTRFSGSYPNHYTYMFVLQMHMMNGISIN